MAEKPKAGGLKSFPTGMQMVYGVGIGDALAAVAKGEASVDDLMSLRNNASAIVDAQGDLVAALKALDAEIAKRGTRAPAAPEVDRFVVEIRGVALPVKAKDDIEKAIQKVVAMEIASIDTRGDMVETSLAKLGKFGSGIGARTRGRYLINKTLNLDLG